MNTRQIDAALELAQTLNFNRAAAKLCVTQPALSYAIKELENEIGFRIFERSGKGAALTPAGRQFCQDLRQLRDEFKQAVERGQNFSTRYADSITVGIPVRSMLRSLPEALMQFGRTCPEVYVSPLFTGFYHTEILLQHKADALVAMDFEVAHLQDLTLYPLYECGISLIVRRDDPLSEHKLIRPEDLYGRTLMIGGGSPPALQSVQQRLIRTGEVSCFNSQDHDTTLTNVAACRGVCLSPDFFTEDSAEFRRIPFDCPERFRIVLSTHNSDKRQSLSHFAQLLQTMERSICYSAS